MATEITSIEQLSSDDISDQQTILTEFLQEKYPDIDISHGVFHDLVQYVNAIFSAKERTELERWKSARSLLAIEENGDLADSDSVDHIMSNYNVERTEGTVATGTLMLEFSTDSSTIINKDTVFSGTDIDYTTTKSYLVYSTGNTTTVADRVLVKLANGNYGCTIDVTASTIGSAGCIKRGTLLNNSTIPNLVSAYAYDDFYGGTDTETNTALLTRLKSGIATPCWGSRDNIESLIVNNSGVSGIVDVSVIGCNDTEMQRDQITLFPISTGGKIDVYVKSSAYTITKTVEISAVAVKEDARYTYWTATIPSSALPGAWRVTDVSFTDNSLSTDLDLISQKVVSTDSNISAKDASYTVKQNIVIELRTTKIAEAVTKTFNVVLMGLPSIATIQEACDDRAIAPVESDVLIKAAVPYITYAEIKLKYNKYNPVTETTINNIKKAVASYINNKGFCSYITTADLATVVYSELGDQQVVAYIQLTGTIFGPDNTVYKDSSSKQLIIPDMPLEYISKNTTTFFSDVTYIDVTTECVND